MGEHECSKQGKGYEQTGSEEQSVGVQQREEEKAGQRKLKGEELYTFVGASWWRVKEQEVSR